MTRNQKKIVFFNPLFIKNALILIAFLLSLGTIHAQKKKKLSPKKDYLVTLKTSYGDMKLLLYEDTPIHRENFIKLSQEGFYDSTGFHRVIKNFMIQGGDPNSKPGADNSKAGRGGPGYTLSAEILDKYKHKKGALAAARQGDRVNPERKSSGSQFYIVQNKKGSPHLDGAYTVFGEVIVGLEVVDEIAKQKVDRRKGNQPLEPIRMTVEVEVLKKKKITKLYNYAYTE